MKQTKLLIAMVITFIITALFLITIVYLLNDVSFKETARHPVMIIIIFMLSWIPCIAVFQDIEKRL